MAAFGRARQPKPYQVRLSFLNLEVFGFASDARRLRAVARECPRLHAQQDSSGADPILHLGFSTAPRCCR